MINKPNVSAKFTEKEKSALIELAARFNRSQTDILRVLVIEALAVLKEQDAKISKNISARRMSISKVMN